MMADNSSKPEAESEYPKLVSNELKIKFVNQFADISFLSCYPLVKILIKTLLTRFGGCCLFLERIYGLYGTLQHPATPH
jgi:hypothetical protein